MNRRTFLSVSVISMTSFVGGCLSEPAPENNSETDQPSTEENRSIVSYTFNLLDEYPNEEDPAVTQYEDTVLITGQALVSDGCTVLSIADAPQYTDSGSVSVRVGTKRTDADMCTTAVRELGYELKIQFSGPLPARILLNEDALDANEYTLDITPARTTEEL